MFKLFAKLKTSGNALKYTANIIFLTISCLLICNLLIQLSDERFIKAIFITVAIGLDVFRQYVVALAKYYWRSNWVKSAALWLVYLIHVSVVLLASVGFSLSAIDAKVKTTETYNMERQSIIDNINSNEAEIKKLEPIKETLDIYSSKYLQVSQRIDNLQKVNRELYDQLKNFSEVKVNIDKDIYDTLGAALPGHIEGKYLKLYMLLVLSFLIELCLLLTSWDINLKEPHTNLSEVKGKPLTGLLQVERKLLTEPLEVSEDPLTPEQEELIKFTEALFTDNPNRLNGIEKIFNNTGISYRKCKEYQDYLNSIGAIDISQGSSKAVWTKEEIIKHIKDKAA